MFSLCIAGFLEFFKIATFGVGYIQGSNLFPEPLSSEEEKNYLQRLKKRRRRSKKSFN